MKLMLLAPLGTLAFGLAAPAGAQSSSGQCVTQVAGPGIAVTHCSSPPAITTYAPNARPPAGARVAAPPVIDWPEPARTPPPPPALQAYAPAGDLRPGDYGWMKGRFAGATAEEKQGAAEIESWLETCRQVEKEESRAALAALGIAAPRLEKLPFRNRLCGQVASAFAAAEYPTFEAFQQAMSASEPVAGTYLKAVKVAEGVARRQSETVRDELLARMVGEQALRSAISWGHGELAGGPPLTPEDLTLLRARMLGAAEERDRDNTKWLKSVVGKGGWPAISAVGKSASQSAWLMLQYSDSDPVFQVRALRLMEPLLARDEVSKQHFAYAYDGIMLKLTGRQRFGTDTECRNGRWMAEPLEDESKVEAYRKTVGLPPLSEYLGHLQAAGRCGSK